MQPLLLVDGLRSGIKVLLELVAQVNVYFPETAFAFAEGFEMLIDILPLGVSGIGLLLEPYGEGTPLTAGTRKTCQHRLQRTCVEEGFPLLLPDWTKKERRQGAYMEEDSAIR